MTYHRSEHPAWREHVNLRPSPWGRFYLFRFLIALGLAVFLGAVEAVMWMLVTPVHPSWPWMAQAAGSISLITSLTWILSMTPPKGTNR